MGDKEVGGGWGIRRWEEDGDKEVGGGWGIKRWEEDGG